jgi:hypothetical protein
MPEVQNGNRLPFRCLDLQALLRNLYRKLYHTGNKLQAKAR